MHWLRAYIRSSIGKKQLMAVTGLLLLLYVIFHLAGNLFIFGGRYALNRYAIALRELGPLLWLARAGLLAAFVLHIWAGVSLFAANRSARLGRYQRFHPQVTPFYARSIYMSGVIVLLFVIYHLLHFTFGTVEGEAFALKDPAGRHDLYAMVVSGFRNPLISAFYVASMALLAMHLAHGIPSMLQTLGLRGPKYRRPIDVSGPLLAVLLFLGYTAIPLAVLLGYVKP